MADSDDIESTRRGFLHIATGSFVVVGSAVAVWPLVDQMNPDQGVNTSSSIDVDLDAIAEGQSITVQWRGKPLFIRHRNLQEITAARSVLLSDLLDQDARNVNNPGADARDENRVSKAEWLIVVGVCTHLGCMPIWQSGECGGWLCPCHGSHYDTSGRIRKGPASENLPVPPYIFDGNTKVIIG